MSISSYCFEFTPLIWISENPQDKGCQEGLPEVKKQVPEVVPPVLGKKIRLKRITKKGASTPSKRVAMRILQCVRCGWLENSVTQEKPKKSSLLCETCKMGKAPEAKTKKTAKERMDIIHLVHQ